MMSINMVPKKWPISLLVALALFAALAESSSRVLSGKQAAESFADPWTYSFKNFSKYSQVNKYDVDNVDYGAYQKAHERVIRTCIVPNVIDDDDQFLDVKVRSPIKFTFGP